MKDLIEPKNTIAFLREHGISAKKRYGQNFLIDRLVLNRIIEGAGICADDIVLEIGPGIGTLTQALCEKAGRVIAVEIDSGMIPLLSENLADYDNYEIINDDILNVDLGRLLGRYGQTGSSSSESGARNDSNGEHGLRGESPDGRRHEGNSLKVVANLPYYITTPIIMRLLESRLPAESITVMVQKEVADRMKAAPGGKDYGALTLAVNYRSEPVFIANVPPNCFIPRPNVDSAVISLRLFKEAPVKARDEQRMFAMIKAAFAQRRKTLSNALKNDPSIKVSREEVCEALKSMGLDENIRGERLSLPQFAELSELI